MAHAAGSGLMSLFSGLVLPVLRFALRVVRGVTSVHASLAGCLAVLAVMVALSGVLALALLGFAR